MINSEKIYKQVLEHSYGYSLGNIWLSIAVSMKNIDDTYEIRKSVFFTILEKLIKDRHVKLALDGYFLKGPVVQQVQLIKNAWPPYPSNDEFDELDEIGLWFLSKCPAGLVWITPEGEEIWT